MDLQLIPLPEPPPGRGSPVEQGFLKIFSISHEKKLFCCRKKISKSLLVCCIRNVQLYAMSLSLFRTLSLYLSVSSFPFSLAVSFYSKPLLFSPFITFSMSPFSTLTIVYAITANGHPRIEYLHILQRPRTLATFQQSFIFVSLSFRSIPFSESGSPTAT